MAVADPLFWFDARTDGCGPWRVYLATERGCPDLKGLSGLTYRHDRQIFISAHTLEDIDSTVYHELWHGIFVGAQEDAAEAHGFWLRAKHEEKIVKWIEPRYLAMARAMGWNLPRKPRGFAELCRKAERINDLRGS